MHKEIQELTSNDSVHAFFDFGKDAFGTLEIELDGEFFDNTEVIIGEIARDGKIVHEPGFTTFFQHIFQLKNGHHTYRIPIPPHMPANMGFRPCHAPVAAGGEIAPFRYVEVNRHYGKVTARRTIWHCDWDDKASDFDSSDPTLNRIWEFCKYSIKATSAFDCYVDGERERKPYEGDAYINQLGHFCCDTNFSLAKNTIQYFLQNGNLSWPTEWILLTPMLVRDYLLYSGDHESVKRWIPYLDEKLLPQFMTKDGLLSPASFIQNQGGIHFDEVGTVIGVSVKDIVDFPPPECDDYEKKLVNFVPNAFLYEALRTMKMLTGNPAYTVRAEQLRAQIRQNFLNDGIFVDSIGSRHTALHSAMTALLFDLAEGDEIAACRTFIQKRGMACSVYGAQHLLDTCYRHGMANYAYSLLTSDGIHSWQNMLREGATITLEGWGDRWRTDNQDWSHAWGAAPANLIPRRLCGIRPTAPGFSRFIVEPQPGPLEYFNCRQPTIRGTIELNYERDKKLELTVPDGTEASFHGNVYGAGTHRLSL